MWNISVESRIQDEYLQLFKDNVVLLMNNKDKIIKNPKFANIVYPKELISNFYGDLAEITLGELFQLYIKEPQFSCECPICKGKMYFYNIIYSYTGKPTINFFVQHAKE